MMQRLLPTSLGQLRRPTLTQLRIIYSIVALVALISVAISSASIFRNSIKNSDDCLWTMADHGDRYDLIVAKVMPGGNADRAGVMEKDRVLAINGILIPSTADITRRAQKILDDAPSGVPISYMVERDGRVLDLRIILTKQPIFFQFVVPAFALLWLVIGMVVVVSQPRGLVQRRFFFTAVAVSFAFSFPDELLLTVSGSIFSVVWVVMSALFYPLWLLFCEAFPVHQRLFTTPLRKLALYGPALLILAAFGSSLIAAWTDFTLDVRVIRVLALVAQIIAAIYFTLGISLLFRGYRRLPSGTDRRPVTVILAGTIIAALALLYITVLSSTQVAGLVIFYPQYLFPVLLLLALPISFGYAIFKYQVMDFRRVIKTTLVYTATMTLIAGLYLAVGYAVGQALGALTSEVFKGTVEVISFVLFLLLFEPVKRQVQRGIENRFFPQRRDYSAHMATYAAEIAETVGTGAVASLTARTLKNALDLSSVCVVLEDGHNSMTPIARESDFAPIIVDDAAITKLRRLLRESHSLISLDLLAEPALASLGERFSYAIGLYAQGKVIGTILMSRPYDEEALSGSQTPFIAGVAAQGAAALEVARLYEEELARQRYREELATARRIQESLLPTTMPQIQGISISAASRPAAAVGGDYYDVIRIDDDRFLVVVADVSGKGLPASLYMAEFHGMVHVACAMLKSPKEILTTLNEHLFEIITRGSFITATMLLFDTARRSVSFARAGHTPIIRRNQSEVDTLVPTGVALGLCAHNLFAELLAEYTVEYEPGETFILYSDGVSEAMNEKHEEFGEGRLHDIVAGTSDANVDALRNRILTRVEEFRGGAEQNDDITIVVVRIEKDVPRELPAPEPMEVARG
jgi:serine phosphatase RsbU (regulator of sigma subunit)